MTRLLPLAMLLLAGCDTAFGPSAGAPAASIDPSSESCGACHTREYAAWVESPHGRSSDSPVFRALVAEVRVTWGEAVAQRCEGCHAPGHDGSDRIGCVTCHQAVGNRGTRDALLVVEPTAPIASPRPPTGPTPHATRPGRFLAASELCATCHVLTGPEHFVESTWDEFLESPAAEAGLTCQSCHFPRVDGRGDHGLVSVTPPWGRGATLLAERREAAAALVAGALELTVEAESDGVTVRLTNARGGHSVPTGATLVRELWVEVRSADAGVPRALTLVAEMTRDGVAVPLPTEADEVHPAALAPGASIARTLSLTPPVEATLYLRPVRADSAEALGLDPDAPELRPITVMTTRYNGP